MILYVITPVSRPSNLSRLGESIASAAGKSFDVRWIAVFDDLGEDVGGARKRNAGLELALAGPPGWLYFLDDDNLLHPQFPAAVSTAIAELPEVKAFCFRQLLGNCGPRGETYEPRVEQGRIDQGQFVVHASAIGTNRFIEREYANDYYVIRSVVDSG